MLANSSSTSDDHLKYYCSNSKIRHFIIIGFSAMKAILILPLSIFILHMGYQRWRQQRSFNTASHSDVFSYHLAATELFWGAAMVCYISGFYGNSIAVIFVGLSAFSFTFYTEMFFHFLTCAERYLAVVHPIIYRGLRNSRGVRIRNISIGCVWFLCFGLQIVYVDLSGKSVIDSVFFFLVICIIVITFCSFSVLCALIRTGPGERGGEKERVDQSKRRAFYTITAISVTQWLWFISLLFATAVSTSPLISESIGCVITGVVGFLNLPSCLVSPLLFLHRAGKLYLR